MELQLRRRLQAGPTELLSAGGGLKAQSQACAKIVEGGLAHTGFAMNLLGILFE